MHSRSYSVAANVSTPQKVSRIRGVFPERIDMSKSEPSFLLKTYLEEMRITDPALHLLCNVTNKNYLKYITVSQNLIGGAL